MKSIKASLVGASVVGLLAAGVVPAMATVPVEGSGIVVPSAPPVVLGIVGGDSVTAMWEFPTGGQYGALSFEAVLDTKSGQRVSDCETTDNRCDLKGLVKDTDYRISVTATNSVGSSPATTWDFSTKPYVWESPKPSVPVKPVSPKLVTKKYSTSIRARVVKSRVKIDTKRTSKNRGFVLQRKTGKKWVTVRKGGIKRVQNRKVKKGTHRLTVARKGNYPAATINKLTRKWRTVKKTRTVTIRSTGITTRSSGSATVGVQSLPPTPTAPTAPRTPTAVAGNNVIGVSWTPPTSPGQPAVLNSYTATATSGSQTLTCSVSGALANPGCVIEDTTNGQNWTVTVKATNAFGDSATAYVAGTQRPVGAPSVPTGLEAFRSAGKSVTSVKTGPWTVCALSNGDVFCWGYNSHGQLGNGTNTDSSVPVAVDKSGVLSGKTVSAIDVEDYNACAIADGDAYCWGRNDYGQLGNGTTIDSSVPVAVDKSGVLSGKTVSAIDVGAEEVCAIADGGAYCWGRNHRGQFGNGTTTDSTVPVGAGTVGVLAGKTISDLSTGRASTCAISDGKGYCWGYNDRGTLGNGTTTDSSVPVPVNTSGVLAGRTLTKISVANPVACALADGLPFCWGGNIWGALGNGTTSDSIIPVAVFTGGVLNNKATTEISAGTSTTCVVANRQPYCWGSNSGGRLGDGTTTDSSVPVAVITDGALEGNPVDSIDLRAGVGCVTATNQAFCWGLNNYGQLGNGERPQGFNEPVVVDPTLLFAPPSATISWSPPAHSGGGDATYTYYVDVTTNGGNTVIPVSPTTNTSVTIPNPPYTVLWVQVKAQNSAGRVSPPTPITAITYN